MTPAADDGRQALYALIKRDVRIRFDQDADEFADHVVHRLGARAPDVGPAKFFARLPLDDLYLAFACSRGDERAWKEFFDRYAAFMRRFARGFLHEPAAGDLADEVVADLWQRNKLARYEGRSTLRTWLGAVVAHAALNASKTAQRRPIVSERRRLADEPSSERPLVPQAQVALASTEEMQSARLLADLVARAIKELPPETKLLLLLYYEQGLTLDEMEVATRISKASLSRALMRARVALRARVESVACATLGTTAADLRERLDLSRLEIDLAALLSPRAAVEGVPGDGV
jgi:RNA polymerase sigma-70 factor (ECF subfamily)